MLCYGLGFGDDCCLLFLLLRWVFGFGWLFVTLFGVWCCFWCGLFKLFVSVGCLSWVVVCIKFFFVLFGITRLLRLGCLCFVGCFVIVGFVGL